MILSNTQKRAVSQLIERYNDFLNSDQDQDKKIVYFKAPTGSGKTFMMANFIHQMIENNRNDASPHKLVFIIATLSSADLPYQMEQNLLEYKYVLQANYEVIRVESPSSSSSQNKRDYDPQLHADVDNVFIFGKSSFGKNRILTEHGILDAFLDQIKNENYRLIYIRDEAHYGSNEVKIKKGGDVQKFETRVNNVASYIVKMTATPDYSQNIVAIDEKEFENDNIKLIKNNLVFNESINDIDIDKIDDTQIIETACEKFKEVKLRYAQNNKETLNVRPAMLIQVDSEKKEQSEEFQKYIENLTKIIEKHNLSWVKYFSNEKITSNKLIDSDSKVSLKEISRNGSNYDVILFKIGPATGWNIPRACMLVQLRNVASKVLSTQTIGRVRRVPIPMERVNFDQNSIANTYFIYSNHQEVKKSRIEYQLQKQYKDVKFVYGQINTEVIQKQLDTRKYEQQIIENIFDKERFIERQQKYFDDFKKYEFIDGKTSTYGDKVKIDSKITNSIELELYVKGQLHNLRKYLPNELINTMHNLTLNEETGEYLVDKNMFCYILIKENLDSIKQIYNNNLEKINSVSENRVYQIKQSKNLPDKSFITISESNKENNITFKDPNKIKYAYIPIDPNQNNYYFDSKPEISFVKSIRDFLVRNDSNVKLWTKNPLSSNISFEYFDNNSEILSSFPDFIFEIIKPNNIKHYLYIEVKSIDDCNPDKTTKLIDSYKKYINDWKQNNEYRSSNNIYKTEITIAVCFVKIDNNQHKCYLIGASTNEEFNKKIYLEIPNNIKVDIISNPNKYNPYDNASHIIDDILKSC
ncbi:DEAD/DEAH box helicase family protein [Ureaplasma diversum]|uniref:Type III restriction modification system endonuclease subunit, Res n=1 Tax=Ureaplasma diversum NCTC 246 TaxID=1188241 RepID=A0A084EXQ0_9BACT|nr:DEAD/DEAH box helicase family protein [Ureaplasma diversum]KEZ22742.1 Type III restriction modification system endonuclease subunit, Res [Ureaplasma diversum NCTC 246]